MLSPKRVKWRKVQKGKMKGKATRGGTLHFGEYGLQAMECGKITSKQIEAARVAMTRFVKRDGNVWIRIFPDKPLTKKAAETRMGSGKGNVEEWAAVIKPGRIIYEMAGIPKEQAYEALRLANYKLPVKCKVVTKEIEARRRSEDAVKASAKAAKKAESNKATKSLAKGA